MLSFCPGCPKSTWPGERARGGGLDAPAPTTLFGLVSRGLDAMLLFEGMPSPLAILFLPGIALAGPKELFGLESLARSSCDGELCGLSTRGLLEPERGVTVNVALASRPNVSSCALTLGDTAGVLFVGSRGAAGLAVGVVAVEALLAVTRGVSGGRVLLEAREGFSGREEFRSEDMPLGVRRGLHWSDVGPYGSDA